MCNLYRMDRAIDEAARVFDARVSSGTNAPAEIYPGYPGLIAAGGELRSMAWGLPKPQVPV